MRKKHDLPPYDDGRTIAPMNVEGMPWYVQKEDSAPSEKEPIKLTRREMWSLLSGVMLAVLAIGVLFFLAYFLFILFCTNVWFR